MREQIREQRAGTLTASGAAVETSARSRWVTIFDRINRQATPAEMDRITRNLEDVLDRTEDTGDQAELVAALTEGETYSPAERARLETEALSRWFRLRQDLLADSLRTAEVAVLLGTSRQTPHDRVKSGSLLAVLDNGAFRFPAWQFDADGPDGVVSGLPEIVRALKDVSNLAKINWFLRPNATLEGLTPLQALRQGEVGRLVEIARGVGVR